MPVFFKVILIIILGWYLFKLFLRFILPFILRYIAQQTLKNMNRRYQQQNRDQSFDDQQNEKRTSGSSAKQRNEGEYVDYEEIKE